jgi:glucosaminylphosphatidylinositol acyltransferase
MQEHMSEYGVHWNFFLTLSVTAFVSAVLPMQGGAALSSAVALLATYQTVLLHLGVAHWLERHDRNLLSVLDANKEGIVSLAGYLPLAYLGRASACMWTSDRKCAMLWKHFVVATGGTWVMTLWLEARVHPISRRMANAPYVTFIAGLAGLQLGQGVLAEVMSAALQDAEKLYPAILQALSRRQLLVFLFANVLTGVVNMGMSTLDTGNALSFTVLLIYTFSWTLAALVL